MKKSVMSVKSMIETYVRYGLDETTWEMYYNMANHNLISLDDWIKFSNICGGWVLDDNASTIIDTNDDFKAVYKTDEMGYWVKVK